MTSQQLAAFHNDLSGLIEEIDSLFREYGFDPEDFDEDSLEDFDESSDVGYLYQFVQKLKEKTTA